MDIVDRLVAYRDYIGLTSSQFADKAGIPRPTLSQFLNGRNKRLSDDMTAKLHAAFPDLNILWLLFGEGDMVTSANIEISEGKNTEKSPQNYTRYVYREAATAISSCAHHSRWCGGKRAIESAISSPSTSIRPKCSRKCARGT